MMMVCEDGRQKDAVPGPLERRGFWFLGTQKKRLRGTRSGAAGAYHHGETMQDVDLDTDDGDWSSR